MKTMLSVLALMPVLAHAECVMQEKTRSTVDVKIQERTTITRDIINTGDGNKKCMVSFRVRINDRWHSAFGDYAWPGDVPSSQACAVAVDRAEGAVRDRVGRSRVTNERVLICSDDPEMRALRQSDIGTVGTVGQFNPHPSYPDQFYHNGTVCRWFTEPQFTGSDIHNFQGVICQVERDRWVVIDKF